MLPKEERRAMLLRLFNDDTPLINSTLKKNGAGDISTPDMSAVETPTLESAVEAEDVTMMHENVQLGEDEQEQVDTRETWTKAGDEEDRFNTTV
jgi:multisite-specific tRNA:(cytosine-C5)-methyltransferase